MFVGLIMFGKQLHKNKNIMISRAQIIKINTDIENNCIIRHDVQLLAALLLTRER